ncbi:DUF5000 domain-containing lipoprotein [Limibacterium fermenti]|uniref:DUF5000 domain-containing lipoprotein n=1 Tax=Limibacterium fermenti TaxID=3229863 RepID=UPI003A6174B6
MKTNILTTLKCLAFLFVTLCIYTSCSPDEEDTSKIPNPLTNVSAENTKGGAVFFYDTPQENEVILVTAEYPIDNGATKIERFDITKYSSSLTLTGLSTQKRKVELYTTNKHGNRSAGVEVEVEPLLSSSVEYLNKIMASVSIAPVVNGITISFSNNSESKEVFFNISYKDIAGNWYEYNVKPSANEQEGIITLENLPYAEFSIYLSDSDEERSEAKLLSVTPVIEEVLITDKWVEYALPGDNSEGFKDTQWGTYLPLKNLWDGIKLHSGGDGRFENLGGDFPQSYTIDLGANQELKLSRIIIYSLANYKANTYGNYNPKVIEVYVSNDPATDGSWESWTKLAECVSVKPSGSPIGTVTDSDFEYIRKGESFKLTITQESYRYIRLKVIETWGGVSPHVVRLDEIELWGISK